MHFIEQNLLFFVGVLIAGSIPHKVHISKKSSKRKGYNLELEAYLWQFSHREHDWDLHITGVRLLNQKIRDTLDR